MFPSFRSVRESLQDLARDFDAGRLTPEQSVRVVEELGRIRRVVDGLLAMAAKRVDETDAHVRRGERNAPSLVARAIGGSWGEAQAAIETAKKLEELPVVDAAVRSGRLSGRQAQMIADAASVNPDATGNLLDAAARGLTPLKDECVNARAAVEDAGERACRQRKLRSLAMRTDEDGMLAGRFRLTPEIGGQVKAAIDDAVQRTFRARRKGDDHEPLGAYAADALVNFVLGGDESPKGVQANVHIVVDHGALMRGGPVEGEVCEIPGVGPVDVGWVRELLGSAFLTVVIKKSKDILTVANVGRHVPAEVQTALLVSGRECDIEGCDHRGYLERDHVHGYAQGGPTAFWNLGWLCYLHHRLKSKGWALGPPDPVTRKRTLRPPPARAA